MKQKSIVLSLALVLGAGLSCDMNPTRPHTTGSISIQLLTQSGAAFRASARESTSDITPIEDAPANVMLDGARVTVTSGSTTKTVSSSTPSGGSFNLTVTELPPGSYTVTVEGLAGGQVAHFGQTTGVNVVAGQTAQAAVTFPVFQPQVPEPIADTTDVLRFTVAWPAVQNATSYIVSWSQSPAMTNPQTATVTTTTREISVAQEGNWYYTVKAVNSTVSEGGLASTPRSVYVFQGVATVTVTPSSPTIAAGSTQQLAAEARDGDNNVVSNVTWFWASSNHSVATVSQSGLVTGVGGGQATISAIAKGTPGNATVGVTALPGVKLAFTLQPGNTTAGQTIPNVQVAVQNINGQTVTADNTTQVTIAIGTDAGPGGVLAGLQTVSVMNGVANFTNLSIAKAGSGYTLTAAATGLSSVTSALFNVVPGPATQLAFTVQPSSTSTNTAISPAVQVTVQDALANRVTSASDAITIAIGTNPSSATLNGTRVVNAINGVASFSGLSLDKGGSGYTLTASSGSLAIATSAAFDIAAPLPASRLAFTVQPSNNIAGQALSPAIQVEIQDADGKRITSSRDAVTIAIATNPSIGGAGTLIGTLTVNAIDGVASFTGVSIQKTGQGYTLSATAASLTNATSAAFDISPAAPAKLTYSGQPSSVHGNVAINPAVAVIITDQYDNATTATNSVTLALSGNPWRTFFATGGTLAGTVTRSAVAGVATFNDLRVDKPGPGYDLSASSGSLLGALSSPFSVTLAFTNVSVGADHVCGRTASGSYCWGYNWAGQLGTITGNTQTDSIAGLVRTSQSFANVTTGYYHSCGLTAAGAAYCWGYNNTGQLGNNSTLASDVPVAVSGGLVFQSIEAGGQHTCGITTASATAAIDRQVYCWGYNGQGQIGDGQALGTTTQYLVPTRVVEPLRTTTRATQVSAGANHTCVRAEDTNLYCWGYNNFGQLGNGTTLTNNAGGVSTATPQQVINFTNWSSVSAGETHTCGVRVVHASSNPILCWGRNNQGQLGVSNANASSSAPLEVSNLNWQSISAGSLHSCAVLSGGIGHCWGYNGDGRLGDDSQTNITTPVQVSGSINFSAIHAGGSMTCGRSGTNVYCWGSNWAGQLGSPGTGNIKRVPTQIIQ